MNNFYPILIIDSTFHVDHVYPKKLQINEEYRVNPNYSRTFSKLIRHRKFREIPDGKKEY